MRLLLDTHALWHHASDGDGLSPRAARSIDEAGSGDLHFLDLSLYELARHMAIGRIEVEHPAQALAAIESAYAKIQSDAEIAWRSATWDWPKRRGVGQHLDPADRAILAAAAINGLVLVTADKELHHFAARVGVSVLW